jgi:hypothetical protein
MSRIRGRMLEMEDQVVALQQAYVVRMAAGQPSAAEQTVQAIAICDYRQ